MLQRGVRLVAAANSKTAAFSSSRLYASIALRQFHTSLTTTAAEATASTPAATPLPRSLESQARAAGFSRRLIRLSDNIEQHRKATFEDGKWVKAKLNAADVARFRKLDLTTGGTWSDMDLRRARLRRIEPTVLKGKKREKIVLDRKAKIVEAMKDMEDRVEDHRKSERARRTRPTFYQMITGKKPSGVIAAEEAALKEKKEKNREREKARQAAQK